ncbi:unnamed protein product [Meloidogyne enterolobii]|uniref:Uncharacterized protein n=1 Tax=Meloidogyne enterolobii TaxID=390850 RepID=A0ACB1B6V9_MELEN
MSDFDPKYFSREEIKQFGTILERLREFEKSVAQTLRKMESKIEEIDKAEIKNKNSITATKGNITKLGNKIMGRIVEIERVLKIDENLDDSNSGDEFQETNDEPEVRISDPFLNNGVYVGNFDGRVVFGNYRVNRTTKNTPPSILSFRTS